MRISMRICSSVLLLSAVLNAQKTSVVTVAGGYQGNHKAALLANFSYPSALAFDRTGTLYIGDSYDCEIRKISKQGTVEVIAGTGICGFSGDGGRATSAMLSSFIGGIVFDANGNLLFSDSSNMRIRKITPAGVISTIAGTGTLGYFGDGGPATQAQLAFPRSIALDNAGNLFIADSNNFVVREVSASGIINTAAGNHTPGYSGDGGPATAAQLGYVQGLAADGNRNLYIGDGLSHVRELNSSNGLITTVAGNGQNGNTGDGGPGTAAAIGGALALALNGPSTLDIVTYLSIWSLDLATGSIHLIAGATAYQLGFAGDGGTALSATFYYPNGIAVDSLGNLFVADSGNNRIRKIAASSQIITTVAGGYTGDGHQARDASLDLSAQGGHIAFDRSGNLYIADSANHRIRKVSPIGVITTIAGNGTMGYSGDGGPATTAQLSHPSAVVFDSQGNLFIADAGNGRIRKVDSTGTITSIQPNGPIFGSYIFEWGVGLAIDSADNIYFSDGLTVVWKMDSVGNASIVAGTMWGFGSSGDGGPANQAQVYFPTGITLDSFGNLYICEWLGHRVRKVDSSGVITTVAGTGIQGFSGDGGLATAATLNFPADVTTDMAGNLYIADAANVRIRRIDSAGIIQSVVGSGGVGYNGERVPTSEVNIYPVGLAFSPAATMYFADAVSNRVRQVSK